jgi:hypothetical protein
MWHLEQQRIQDPADSLQTEGPSRRRYLIAHSYELSRQRSLANKSSVQTPLANDTTYREDHEITRAGAKLMVDADFCQNCEEGRACLVLDHIPG